MFIARARYMPGFAILALVLSACGLATPVPASLPDHTISDFWQNDERTNIAYFLVADKSLSEEDARAIIQHYLNEEEGYKLINIWIFCDATYARQMYLNDVFATEEEFYSYLLYRYQAGEWSSEGVVFQSEADAAHPAFGSACK